MLGLAASRPGQALTVLNLGSHWKAIQVSESGQITRSWTTLSGELLHAIMTQTILASAVPLWAPRCHRSGLVSDVAVSRHGTTDSAGHCSRPGSGRFERLRKYHLRSGFRS